MMFAHGFGCDQNMWRYVAPAFEDAFRTILFDHVGAGGSDLSQPTIPPNTPSSAVMPTTWWKSGASLACRMRFSSVTR